MTGLSGLRPESRATEFVDTVLTSDNVVEISIYRRSIAITTLEHIVVFKGRARRQLLSLVGSSVSEAREDPDLVRRKILEALKQKELFVRCLKLPNVLYAVRVTTERYVVIPHKMLVELGKRVFGREPDEVMRYRVRTVFLWLIAETPRVKAYVAISNANTGSDAVHVYGYFKIVTCSNGAFVKRLAGYRAIPHVGTVESVLAKVEDAIKYVTERMKQLAKELDLKLEELARIELSDVDIESFLRWFRETFPRKYFEPLVNAIKEFRKMYGDSLATIFQAITYVIPRASSEVVANRLSSLIESIVIEGKLDVPNKGGRRARR